MANVLVFMTCANGHDWARVGTYKAGTGKVILPSCSGEGASDDPTCCETCHEPVKSLSLLGEPKAKRRRR